MTCTPPDTKADPERIDLHSHQARDRDIDYPALSAQIARWGHELGFQQVGVADVDLSADEARLLEWVDKGRHGEMRYMTHHGLKRSRPALLEPGTTRVICVRMDYWPGSATAAERLLADADAAYVSRYALGRDYHKVLRRRLQKLADRIEAQVGPFGYRAFTDSAPVLEKPLARNAGLGWIGKHTNLINRRAGSWFFLGELYTDLPLPVDEPANDHCGSCRACIDACPTGAIVAPYQLDARLCISYLTIELHGSIPVGLRALIGNRVYGCDDCQLVCPWNRYARATGEADFEPRHGLDSAELTALFGWSEAEFEQRTEGSAIRRIGYVRWLRNVAVGLGNAKPSRAARVALEARTDHPSAMVREHVAWALERQSQTSEPAANVPGVLEDQDP